MLQQFVNGLKSHHERFYPFGLLVFAQVCVLIIPAFEEFLGSGILLSLMYSFVVIISIYIVTSSAREFQMGVLLSSFVIIFLWISYATDARFMQLLHLLSSGAFFSFCAYKLWIFLYRQDTFNVNTILGAIAGYMFIGFICAMVLTFIQMFIPDAFKDAHFEGSFDMIYLSFVTITTLGYGDLVPVHPISRSFCILFAVAGQVYLTVILAIIVGQFLQKKSE
jgi:voltage-gated potassium channel Kch